jgi:putative nucleotidyltransferase with HDIG domain
MDQDEVKKFIKGIKDLSTTPALMGRIISVVDDPEASSRDLFSLISHDHTLAEKVVRVANSALFGHSGEVKDIGQAIMLLGYDRIKSIAVGMSVMALFPSRKSFNPVNLWRHSYEIAVFSEAFSDIICMTCPKECFLAGLLHDIGRIILYKMDAKSFLDIKHGDDVSEKEKEFFGCTHAEAGAWFATENSMPPEIVSAIQFHHKPSLAREYKDAVSIVSLAEALSRRFSQHPENDGVWSQEHDMLFMEYSLTDDDLLFVSERYCAVKPEIEKFFCNYSGPV